MVFDKNSNLPAETGEAAKQPAVKKRGLPFFQERILRREKALKTAPVVKSIFHIATLISSFDLKLSFSSAQTKAAAGRMRSMSAEVASAAEEISVSTSQIVEANNELHNEISRISEDAAVLKENSLQSNERLGRIQTENHAMAGFSKEMQQSMEELLEWISKINEIVRSIDRISDQTKLLSLNATIEAARVGSAGRGFTVVADEIRKLSASTKDLTSGIGELLAKINDASGRSSASVAATVKSVGNMQSSIDVVSDMLASNTESIGMITDRIAMIAETSETINASLQESYGAFELVNNNMQHLSRSAEQLESVSSSLHEVSDSVASVETSVDDLAVATGKMVSRGVMGLSNEDFIQTMESAAQAHTAWLGSLKAMADSMTAAPIQTDEHKCGFGHFYYAIKPSAGKLAKLWKNIEELHHSLHSKGDCVLHFIQQRDAENAAQCVRDAESISKEILGAFEQIIAVAREMAKNGESVF